MLRKIHKSQSPKFLIITPLSDGEELSEITLESVFSETRVSFDWIRADSTDIKLEGVSSALFDYQDEFSAVPMFIRLDNHAAISSGLLDNMYYSLCEEIQRDSRIAYVFSDFSYVCSMGTLITKFEDLQKVSFSYLLYGGNYISSNIMIRTSAFHDANGEDVNIKYGILNDYALLLKFIDFFWTGKYVEGNLELLSEKISNVFDSKDFLRQMGYVVRDLVIPLRDKYGDELPDISTLMKASLLLI